MSEVSPPVVRVEIYSNPALFDDHFLKGWTFNGTPTRNGQTILINTGQSATRNLNISTAYTTT